MGKSGVGHRAPDLRHSRGKLPPRTRVTWVGQFNYFERAKARLQWVIPLTLGMVMLLYFNMKSVTKTAIVMLAVPFSRAHRATGLAKVTRCPRWDGARACAAFEMLASDRARGSKPECVQATARRSGVRSRTAGDSSTLVAAHILDAPWRSERALATGIARVENGPAWSASWSFLTADDGESRVPQGGG